MRILIRRWASYRPEIVDQDIEDAQDDHQHHRTPFRLEPHYYHDTSNEPEYTDHHPPNAPLAWEDKPDKEKDQQHPPGKLDIHFAIFLIHWREARGCKLLANPWVAENHEEATHNTKVAEEEV